MDIKDLQAFIEEEFTGEGLADAKLVARDVALLLSAKASGASVSEEEFDHAKAAAANLVAAKQEKVRATVMEWTATMVGALLDRVIPV